MGGVSTALFFLEPNPFESDKLIFLLIVGLSMWVIYTIDHLFDGLKSKGQSGVFRYDFLYRYRIFFWTSSFLITAFILWLIAQNIDKLFISNGFYITPVLALYFILKMRKKLNPFLKMGIVAFVVAMVMVLIYQEESLFTGLFQFDFLMMVLLVFFNQLVLETFEIQSGDFENNTFNNPETYKQLASRVFIWLCVLLGISLVLNPFAWPNILTLLLVGIALKCILRYETTFKRNELYRFWADFVFVLIWPVYTLFMELFKVLI